jgi:DNA repair protein RadC
VENYSVKEIRFVMVRESESDPRHLQGPAAAVAAIKGLGMLIDDARERFIVIFLNSQNVMIGWHQVSLGILNASLVHPREVFGPALRVLGTATIILAHNHPSGDPTPSREDIQITRKLVEAGKLLDIPVHDHLIIGDGTDAYVSLSEKGLV